MEPMRGQDFVHALMVKLNRASIAAILTVIAIYGLVAYRGPPRPHQGSGTGESAHLTTTSVMACSGGSGSATYDQWLAPAYGPR